MCCMLSARYVHLIYLVTSLYYKRIKTHLHYLIYIIGYADRKIELLTRRLSTKARDTTLLTQTFNRIIFQDTLDHSVLAPGTTMDTDMVLTVQARLK